MFLYADDLKLYTSVKIDNVELRLQKDLDLIHDWSRYQSMKITVIKI